MLTPAISASSTSLPLRHQRERGLDAGLRAAVLELMAVGRGDDHRLDRSCVRRPGPAPPDAARRGRREPGSRARRARTHGGSSASSGRRIRASWTTSTNSAPDAICARTVPGPSACARAASPGSADPGGRTTPLTGVYRSVDGSRPALGSSGCALDTFRSTRSATRRPRCTTPPSARRWSGCRPAPAARDVPQARNPPADWIVQDPRRVQRGAAPAAGVARRRRLDGQRRQRRAGRRAGRARGRRRLQRARHGHRAGHQARGHRAARRHHRQGVRTTSAGGRSRSTARTACPDISSTRSTTTTSSAATAPSALEIVEDLPDVDAVIAPLGGGGLLAGIGVGLRGAAPGGARLRRRAGDRGAAVGVARRRPRQPLRRAGSRRSSTAPAGSSVLASMWPLLRDAVARLDRRPARRRGAGDEAGRRPRARDRRRRGGLRGRRGASRRDHGCARPSQDRGGRLGRQHRPGALRAARRAPAPPDAARHRSRDESAIR